MSRIIRLDEKLNSFTKPTLHKIANMQLNNEVIFVTCAGFEDRSTALLKNLVESNHRITKAIIIEYIPKLDQNKSTELCLLCDKNKIPYKIIQYDRQNLSGMGQHIVDSANASSESIVVDISGMSRFLIVQMIVALGNRVNGFYNSFIGYSEAEKYPPSKEEVSLALAKGEIQDDVDLYFLSSGVFDISIVPELSSVALQGQPIRLVYFPSFNPDQLNSLRAVIQPSYISIIHGRPPSKDNEWRLEAISKCNFIEHLLHKEEYIASTISHDETVNIITQIYNKYGDMQKIVIAPTGSKMQSVAIGIVRTFLTDIQIVYPTTRLYSNPNEYTHGVKDMYLLPLSSYNDLIKLNDNSKESALCLH